MVSRGRHMLLEETRVVSLMAQWRTDLRWSLRLYILWCSLTVILLWRWDTGGIGHSDQLVSHMIIISINRGPTASPLSLIYKLLRPTWYLSPCHYLALPILSNRPLCPLIRWRIRVCRSTLDTHTGILWILVICHWGVGRVRYVYGFALHETSACCFQWVVQWRSEICHLLLKNRDKGRALSHG